MKILVLFKTHLDIGFTDYSENVIKKYMTGYLPTAIRVGRELQASGRSEGFTWTTGSWLIWHYLHCADAGSARVLDEAIRDKLISWHALPATMHSELMDGNLFDYGLSLSKELDERFGRKTFGAKMSDVPGHTKAIVPHLSDAGIRFLHIGINPASCPVEVPFLFRWRFEGHEIAVMYESGDYGGFRLIPGTDVYVCFAHTGDNLGPQSSEEIIRIYDDIHRKYPGAEVKAADLNDVAEEISKVWDDLPVITQEIGDTWIHGAGTDPQKLTQFRSLLRFAHTLPDDQKRKLYEHLLLVPEHTWGLDEKTFLNENHSYSRERFDLCRNDYKFKKMELSWAEQRRYLTDGTAALDMPYRKAAVNALTEYTRPRSEANGESICAEHICLGRWQLSVDENGAISFLKYGDLVIADVFHKLFGFSYDEYCADEVWAFQERYLRASFWNAYRLRGETSWAIEDFGKEGLCEEITRHAAYLPELVRITADGESLIILTTLPAEANIKHGCPRSTEMKVCARGDELHFDFLYHGKHANRAPEALWLSFLPMRRLTGISKLGYLIDPTDVADKGAREMHATDGTIEFDGFELISMDAPLISVDGKHIYSFRNRLPDPARGIYINLFNNQWGTNFPMWTEGDRRFRFTLKITDK